MNESLLALLKKEDGLVRDVRLNKETYEMLRDKNKHSFHKMQGRCNEFIMATTSYEARIKSILENKTEDE